MLKEFKILVDIWGPPNKEGKSKIIKKNVAKLKTINLNDITSIEQLTTSKGRIIKNICFIECGERTTVVKYKYEDLLKVMSKTRSAGQIGFRYKNRE